MCSWNRSEGGQEWRGCPDFTPTPGLSLFFNTCPPTPTPTPNRSGDCESVLSSWHVMWLTVLFILSNAHSRDYEKAVGNGDAGLKNLKLNVKFSPSWFLILKRFWKFSALGRVQGWDRKKTPKKPHHLLKQGFVVLWELSLALWNGGGGAGWKPTVDIFLGRIKCFIFIVSLSLFCFMNTVYLSPKTEPAPTPPGLGCVRVWGLNSSKFS